LLQLVGVLLVGPHQACTGAFTLWVDLQGSFEIGDAGMRLGNSSQDQPGAFHIRRQRGGNLRPGAGGMFIATLQGIGGLFQGLVGQNGLACHGNFYSDNSTRILLRLATNVQQYFYGNRAGNLCLENKIQMAE
jgi:hypothetical protein